VNTIDTSQLLAQLRMAAAQVQPAPAEQPAQASPSASFSTLLSQSIDKVNAMQQTSSRMQEAFQMGDPNVSLSEVMIAKSKAGLAFDGMVQVRNKMVEAYQEIMRMPV